MVVDVLAQNIPNSVLVRMKYEINASTGHDFYSSDCFQNSVVKSKQTENTLFWPNSTFKVDLKYNCKNCIQHEMRMNKQNMELK